MTEVVPAPEPARRPALSPEPGTWQPPPRRVQEVEETGPFWRRWGAGAHVVLGLIATLVIVVMAILVARAAA